MFMHACAYARCIHRIDSVLTSVEERHHIRKRWAPGMLEYATAKAAYHSKRKYLLMEEIEALSRERWFLLSLKAKYAGI